MKSGNQFPSCSFPLYNFDVNLQVEGLGYKYPKINLPLGLIYFFGWYLELIWVMVSVRVRHNFPSFDFAAFDKPKKMKAHWTVDCRRGLSGSSVLWAWSVDVIEGLYFVSGP